MRFEDQITVLCAEALAAEDEESVRSITAQLRHLLHQRIEKLRHQLVAAYPSPTMRLGPVDDARSELSPKITSRKFEPPAHESDRTWQHVVHEIALEKDHKKALRLSRELRVLLQQSAGENAAS